jgi:hypothetical protein
MKTKLLISIAVIIIVAIAGVLWAAFGPPIIIRNREYRELISNFKQAQPREQKTGDRNVLWDFQIDVPERQTTARVSAVPYPGVLGLKYIDESESRALYEYVDYSHPVEVRTSENILYVFWVERLLRTDQWILAYDLAGRREIVRRKIDPDDLKQSH